MKVAVIGATGYVGNAVVQELAGRGHEVTAFARNTDKVFQAQNVAAVSADVNAADFAGKLAGFDAVVSAFNPGWNNPNIGADFTRGANNIVEAAEAAQVPYLLIVGGCVSQEGLSCSSSEYGSNTTGSDVPRGRRRYSKSPESTTSMPSQSSSMPQSVSAQSFMKIFFKRSSRSRSRDCEISISMIPRSRRCFIGVT